MNYLDDALKMENLIKALKKCANGVRWKDSVVGYESNAIRNTLQLKSDVLNGKYKISPYQEFYVYEPKKRLIVATRIRDRQLQRAVCEAGLYDEMTKSFIIDNVACQNGKGTDFMIKRLKIHMERYYRQHKDEGWVLKCDIHHFFPSTPHETAKQAVRKRVSDERVCKMVCDVIDSFGGDVGIGLGSQISQLIELAVLDDLDHYIKEQLHIKFYMRYMDDFILVHSDKEYLKQCWRLIAEKIESIGLSLNNKTTLYPLKQGIKFCKWHFRYTETGKICMRMDRKKMSRERHKLCKLIIKELNGEIDKGTAFNSLKCWFANAKRGDTYADRNDLMRYYNKTYNEVLHEIRKTQTDTQGNV